MTTSPPWWDGQGVWVVAKRVRRSAGRREDYPQREDLPADSVGGQGGWLVESRGESRGDWLVDVQGDRLVHLLEGWEAG